MLLQLSNYCLLCSSVVTHNANNSHNGSPVCHLGDLEGVPSALLGSISLCSCFWRVILSAACLHDKKQTNMSNADTFSPVICSASQRKHCNWASHHCHAFKWKIGKKQNNNRETYSLSCLVSLTTCEAKDMQVSTTTRYRAQVVCPCRSALWEGRSPCWFWIVTLEPYSTRVWRQMQG